MYKNRYTPILHIFSILFSIVSSQVTAQTVYTKKATPLTGLYPGGHTGVRCATSPAQGVGVFMFNRYHVSGNLIDDKGNNIGATNTQAEAIITGCAWNTKIKVGKMTLGGLLAVPLNNIFSQPTGQNATSTGFALGDIVVVPLGLYGTSKKFDYQVALGVWTSTAKYTYGAPDNHGPGFAEMLYSLGGAYFPDGNHKSFSFSAVARIEQPFKQKQTGIKPGSDVMLDWGIGSPFIPLDKKHKHIIMGGICGFATSQFTKETGEYAALNTSLYRSFAIGGELNYIIPKLKLRFMVRPEWEFGSRNTTQGKTLWVSVGYFIGEILK